ncbi:hypothetical protein [Nonomuraea solani]|uniref:hypothetical protein n=1 Tax=Nonomuraea solani TaxID=1144553 RepID=UPI000CDE89E3|nr:hypothetical protein [Nonomuraea solani]
MPLGQADATADAVAEKHVTDLQQRARGLFLLMYSLYWRRFVAIYMGECDHGIVLKAATPDELWELMSRVAPPDWLGDSLPRLAARPSSAVDVPGLSPVFPDEDADR